MRFRGFIGPSYTLQSKAVDAQRCVNLYPEMNEMGTGKELEVAALYGTPGLRTLLTLPESPIRCIHVTSTGTPYVVAGAKLYSVSSAWVATDLGGLSTSVGSISMADNGIHLVIVDGPNGYQLEMATNTFAKITDPDFQGADQVTYQDGYLIFNKPNSGEFYHTGLNTTDIDALDFGKAEGSPDNLKGLISDSKNLFLFGTRTTEIFYNSGDADLTFQRTQGALIPIGCSAAFSIAELGGSIFWLGADKNGRGVVYRTKGFQPERISTHAIETVITGLGNLSLARAWVYSYGGHSFYCLNLPGASSTWCFDVSTGLWHERSSLVLGEHLRHRADTHGFAYETNVVGDFENGKLYALDPDAYSDDGDPILAERTALHMSSEGRTLFHSAFQLDIESGVGTATGQGSNPKVVLQWSDDGGQTWSNEHEALMGRVGNRLNRAIWRRLGRSRDRIYRVRISDPVKRVLIGANVETEEGSA